MTEETHSSLPCFKCGCDIVIEHEILTDAMTFTSHGGYGSVYDQLDSRKFLRIHLCDTCVIAGTVAGLVLEGTRIPVPDKITYEKWNPLPDSIEH